MSGTVSPNRMARVGASALIAVWLVAFPFVLHHAGMAWRASSNRVEDWVPSGHPETRELDRFKTLFQGDELLAVSWPGCTLHDPRLERLRRWGTVGAAEESESSGGPTGERLRHYFRAIVTADDVLDVLDQWSDTGAEIPRGQRLARLRGWLLGDDGRTTMAIALVSGAGVEDRHAAVNAMRDAATAATGLSRDELRLAGTTIESVATDEANRRSLERLTLLSFLVCGVILFVASRNLGVTALLLGIAIFNQQLSLAVVAWTGGRVDAVLLLMASVMFVLSISAGCHFLRYLREALIRVGPLAAPREAFVAAFRPAVLAAITSSIGFGSLTTSQVIPVQNFGGYAALMVLVCGVTVPSLIVAAFVVLPPRGWHRTLIGRVRPDASGSDESDPADVRDSGESRFDAFARFDLLARLATRWPWVIGVSLVVLAGTGAGLPRLQTALGVFKMFPEDAKILRDYRWIEENVAPLVPVEVMITVPVPDESSATVSDDRDDAHDDALLEELALVRDVVIGLQRSGAVEAVVSPLNFIPSPPRGSGLRYVVAKRAYVSAMRQSAEELAETGFFRAAPGYRHWRVSGRIRSSSDPDFAAVRRVVDGAVAEAVDDKPRPAGTEYQVSGGAIVFDQMQRRLLRDMGTSFVTAVGLIAVLMSVVLRSVVAGFASMLPNLIPPVALFGTMAWFGIPIEIGSVLTASVAVGIAVDDTLHLIHAYIRSGVSTTGGAIADALRHSGPAMMQTTAICCLGMLAFAFSPFLPISRFAWVITTLLALALAGDLVVLPAVLASPLGRSVRRTVRR